MAFLRVSAVDLLEKLYVKGGLTQAETAAKLGVGIPVLLRNLRAHKITFRHKKPPPTKRPECDVLCKLYLEQQNTCAQIAKDYGVTTGTVSRWMKSYGIAGRTTWHVQKPG